MFENMFEKVLSNILYAPKIAKLSSLNLGPIFSSKVQQLHFITEECRSKEIRGGAFSIRPLFFIEGRVALNYYWLSL